MKWKGLVGLAVFDSLSAKSDISNLLQRQSSKLLRYSLAILTITSIATDMLNGEVTLPAKKDYGIENQIFGDKQTKEILESLKDRNEIDKDMFGKLFDEYYSKLSPEWKELFLKFRERKFFQAEPDSKSLFATLLFLKKKSGYYKIINRYIDKKTMLMKRIVRKFGQKKEIVEIEKQLKSKI